MISEKRAAFGLKTRPAGTPNVAFFAVATLGDVSVSAAFCAELRERRKRPAVRSKSGRTLWRLR